MVIAIIMLAMLTSCSFVGSVGDVGQVTVVVEAADGSCEVYQTSLENIENKGEGAKGVLEHLETRADNPLSLEMTNSSYGAYVTAIGNIAEGGGSYVMVYTSHESDSYAGASTVEYEGKTLYQSGVGLSTMTVGAGTVILFRLESNPF